MTAKMKIRVVKKNDIKKKKTPIKMVKQNRKEAGREMVSTVSNWVTDFQTRKRDETKQALEKFFSTHPQANGA